MFERHCACVAQAVTKIQLRLGSGSFSKLLVGLTSDACLFDVERNDLNVEGVQEAIEGSGLSSVDHCASFGEGGGADGEWSGVEEKVEERLGVGLTQTDRGEFSCQSVGFRVVMWRATTSLVNERKVSTIHPQARVREVHAFCEPRASSLAPCF